MLITFFIDSWIFLSFKTQLNMTFRLAIQKDISEIWTILQDAIQRRRSDGSQQWQDGYPNLAVVHQDIASQIGYVLSDGKNIVGYLVLVIDDEPAYQEIEGNWLSNGSFVVFHRMAIAKEALGKGFAQQMIRHAEDFALSRNIHSVRFDTNFDNGSVLHIGKKMGYSYCGEVLMREKPRKAFEKII